MANQEKAFLGTGWAFPPGLDPAGKIRLVSLEEDVRQAILIIIQTVLGERVMRPDFGAGLHNLVFEPVNRTTMALVQNTVERALIDWEPRIEINNLSVTTDTNERNTLLIELLYTVRATNTQFNLVFPFFLLEGETQAQ
jgi:phage baseplate assembly protein W